MLCVCCDDIFDCSTVTLWIRIQARGEESPCFLFFFLFGLGFLCFCFFSAVLSVDIFFSIFGKLFWDVGIRRMHYISWIWHRSHRSIAETSSITTHFDHDTKLRFFHWHFRFLGGNRMFSFSTFQLIMESNRLMKKMHLLTGDRKVSIWNLTT